MPTVVTDPKNGGHRLKWTIKEVATVITVTVLVVGSATSVFNYLFGQTAAITMLRRDIALLRTDLEGHFEDKERHESHQEKDARWMRLWATQSQLVDVKIQAATRESMSDHVDKGPHAGVLDSFREVSLELKAARQERKEMRNDMIGRLARIEAKLEE